MKRALMWIMSRLWPYHRGDRGWKSLAITIGNTTERTKW